MQELEKTWGKAKSEDAQKEPITNVLIPESGEFVSIPLLNIEVYSKINNSATKRNKGTQSTKQLFVKNTMLILKAAVALKEIEQAHTVNFWGKANKIAGNFCL